MAKPSAEFVAAVLATWFSGGVAVPLALSYPETELMHVMNDAVCSPLSTLYALSFSPGYYHPRHVLKGRCLFHLILVELVNCQVML